MSTGADELLHVNELHRLFIYSYDTDRAQKNSFK